MGLTARERDVFNLYIVGRSAPYIAEKLVISESTVKSHLQHIYTKCDVHSRQELMDLVEDTDVAAAGDMLQDILDDRA